MKNQCSGNWRNRYHETKLQESREGNALHFYLGELKFENVGDGMLKTPCGTRILSGASRARTESKIRDWAAHNGFDAGKKIVVKWGK